MKMTNKMASAVSSLGRARRRFLTEQAALAMAVTAAAPCSLCHAMPGQRCVKGGFADIPLSGPARGPHAERRRAAGART